MSADYVSAELRRLVEQRAEWLCEYCLIDDETSFFGCQVDHIISEKHGGPTHLDNLALACALCNRAKGSDIGSIYWESNEYVRLFHPRNDSWRDHFQLVANRIEGLTPVGKVTARLLGWNLTKRIEERENLITRGFYPSAAAKKRM